MAFNPVDMILTVTITGPSIAPVTVTRGGPDTFRLHMPSVPARSKLSDPKPPTKPTAPTDQPFECLMSSLVGGVQTSSLTFDPAAIASWDAAGWFSANRSVVLSMDVTGQPGEKLTVNLSRVVVQASVRRAAAKVVETSGALILAIFGLFKAIALSFARLFTGRRHVEEPELVTANGPKHLE